jgi:renalase
MSDTSIKPVASARVAVIGAGMAGMACAAGLQGAGMEVSLFDKSRGVGGRLATCRVPDAGWCFDHGATHFSARSPRFRAMLARAEAAGVMSPWTPRVHRGLAATQVRPHWVARPDMPALCKFLAGGASLRLQHTVERIERSRQGWMVHTAEGGRIGRFDQVILAMPPAQAAALLVGQQDGWADALRDWPMQPCWSLMAVTPDVDWPWDAVEPDRGPLGWVMRNDRKPGREAPLGVATWVAQATPEWSAAHLEDPAEAVLPALQRALASLLPGGRAPEWLHAEVHRWRYALPAATAAAAEPATAPDCWWDAHLGLGVCGDFLAGGGVEAAWQSGDELADTLVAWLDTETAPAAAA